MIARVSSLKNSTSWRIYIVLFVSALVSSCATLTPNFEKPELQLVQLKMLPINSLEQRFRLTFRVTNPNNVSFAVDGMKVKLTLRDLQVASGVSDNAFVLEPLSDNTFDVDVSASLLNSGRVLLDIINTQPQELDYVIDAKIFTSEALLGTIAVSRRGVIPFNIKTPKRDNSL